MVVMRVGLAVLGGVAGRYLAAEGVAHELCAIADAEDRDPQVEDLLADVRGLLVVDTVGTAGEDDADRLARGELLEGGLVALDLAVDTALTHAPRDELVVLTAEVQDDD